METNASVRAERPKKVKSSKMKPVALRFEVELDLSEDACNIISFPDLVRRASKKKESKRSGDAADSGVNPHDPFGDEDDDEVARIAAQLEEKYGRGSAYEDYIDKGDGYDENDSFIDNAEAYDELIPASLTTEHDGFYINTGELKFKPVEEANGSSKVVEESEFEKAQELQKLKHLKRKRNRIEDDDDSNGNGPPPTTTKVPRKKKDKISIEQSSAATVSLQYDRPPNSSTPTVSVPDPAQNVAQQILPKKYKRQQQQQQQQNLITEQSMLEHLSKQQRKMGKDTSSFTPIPSSSNATMSSSLYGNKGPQPLQSATLHNFIQQSIQQMISNDNAASTSNVNGVGTFTSNNHSLLQLKRDLLLCNVPIEIVQEIPLSKPLSNDCLGLDWDCFLLKLIKYIGTTLSQKNRQKAIDTISRYIGWKQDQFFQYIAKQATSQVNASNSSSSSYGFVPSGSKPSNRKSPSPSAPAPAASPNHAYMSLLSGGSSSNPYSTLPAAAIAQSLVKPKKNAQQSVSNSSSGGNSGGAINLCTNNQTAATSYGEGLAGKLMAPTSSDPSSLLQPVRKTSSSSSKNKSTAESLINSSSGNFSGHGPNFTMLQTLASLANSNSGGNAMTLTTTSSRMSGGGGSPMMAHTGHQLSRSGSASPSLSRANAASSTSSPSPTIISSTSTSSSSATNNPNSLLLSAVAHSAAVAAAAASKTTNSMAGHSSSISSSSAVNSGGSLSTNNQLFNSLFTSLPNLFSNTEILNRFLSADTLNASRSGGVGGGSAVSPHQRMVNEIAKSFASGGANGGGGGGGKSPSVSSSSSSNNSSLNSSLLMNVAQISAQHHQQQHQQQQQQQLHRSNSISSSNSVGATPANPTGLPTFITPSQHSVARSMASSGPVSSALISSILSGVGQQQMPGAGANQKPK